MGGERESTAAWTWLSWRGCSSPSARVEAINLDGGGSATLVHREHLLNRPYSQQDQPAPESRPVVSALCFESRRGAYVRATA